LAIPVDFSLFDLSKLGPSTFVAFLFLVVVVDKLDGKARARITDVVGSGEGGALWMVELATAVLRPPGSRSMPVTFAPGSISMSVTFAADVRSGEGNGDWIGEGAGVSLQDGERALGGDAEGCPGDGERV
jgi:hypothetical protein